MDTAWANVKTPSLLQYVSTGMIRFKPTGAGFPPVWQQGEIYTTRMRIFGFIPFGGEHYLEVIEIDEASHSIKTREWDRRAKVWNHTIILKEHPDEGIYYTDEIEIYGGRMTGLITWFAKRFYIHRQKRWNKVAREGLVF
jgi:hypothetical protein